MDKKALVRWLELHRYRLRLLLVILLALGLFVVASAYFALVQIDRQIRSAALQEAQRMQPLLAAAVAAPLAQRDYAGLEELLGDLAARGRLDYLVLRDGQGRLIASVGWERGWPLPEAHTDIDPAREARLDAVTPVKLGTREIGTLHFGLPLQEARQRREALVAMVAAAGTAGLLCALLLGTFISFGLTRRLNRLVAAGRRLAEGRLDTRIDDRHADELGFVAQAIDAMAQKLNRSSEALRQSEAQLKRVILASSDGYWDWHLASDTVDFSARFRQMLGYDEEEAFRQRFYFRQALHPEDRDRVLAALERSLNEGVPFDQSYRLACRDGAYRWFRGRGQTERDDAGHAVRFSSTLSDIQAQKLAEEEIRTLLAEQRQTLAALRESEARYRKLSEELEQRVAERTAELTAANKELESFSYSVSHDLTAPLRAIDGFSRMIEEDYGSLIDARGKGYIQRVRSGTQRMQRIIDDMLALARVTRHEMRRESVSLSGIAEQILSELKQMHPDRNVETRITLDIHVKGDPNLLRLAMENLLRNAWKFTARRACATIEFGVLRGADEPVYFVGDNGAGFDMKYAGKLFGAFQRMHGPQEFEGTGIGLAIVHRIIQRHGGRIWAEAEPEKGARFYFTLS